MEKQLSIPDIQNAPAELTPDFIIHTLDADGKPLRIKGFSRVMVYTPDQLITVSEKIEIKPLTRG